MTYVLYHAHCRDGFAAATLLWERFPDAVFLPVSYQEPLPEIPDGSIVYIVDFSYPREILIDLWKRSAKLVVLDHHKTAAAELHDLDFAIFNMEKCGALMTWEHLHPGFKMPPTLLAYIQDRDLWRWELLKSREISAWLSIQPMDFAYWSKLFTSFNNDDAFVSAVDQGEAILTYQRMTVEAVAKEAFQVVIDGYTVPAVNSGLLQSEIGEELCKRPGTPFSAVFWMVGLGTEKWSLRALPGFDVSVVAKKYGGGGHPGAAGFKVPRGAIAQV